MRKVIIIGSGGAGKSTLAGKLGKLTGLPVIHLDREYWRPNWEKTPADEWEARVKELITGDSWIMDGNFGGTRAMRMKAADTIIFLDFSRWACLYRIVKRTAKYYGRTRPDMTEDCRESFDPAFFLWIWNYRHRSRVRLLSELESISAKNIIVLKSQREVDRFLNALPISALPGR